MKTLRIATGLALPLEAVTQAIGILAKRRAGKSYAMRRLTEQLLKAGQQVVIIDPKGDQWGIRSAADGVSPGLPVVILGGERADVPLEAHGGEIVAKLVVEDRVSVLLDLSLFRKSEVAVFMSAFLENLYRLKAREIYRTPMMLVIDEADAIAPQKPMKGEERMLGAAEDIVRRGGQRGIGCMLVTQRSAVLNKNVLTQIQLLVVLRTIAPQDLAAIDAWIDVHGTDEERKLLKGSLPSLPVGDAWFWSPGWPTNDGIFERVHVLPIETFDSAATPKPGEKRIEPKTLADVDLDVLKERMAATIEKAKADDPRELRKQIAQLQKEKRALETRTPIAQMKAEPVIERIEVPVLANGALDRIENLLMKATRLIESLPAVADGFKEGAQMIAGEIAKTRAPVPVATSSRTARSGFPMRISHQPAARRTVQPRQTADGFQPSKKQQQILDALAWFESIGIPEPSTLQVGAVALIDASGGHFSNTVGPLSSQGLIERGTGTMRLTDAGRAIASVPENVATLDEYHDVLRARVRRTRSAGGKTIDILNAIIARGGGEITTAEIGAEVGMDHTGGHFSNMIGPLGTVGLIERRSGVVRPTAILFPPGLD